MRIDKRLKFSGYFFLRAVAILLMIIPIMFFPDAWNNRIVAFLEKKAYGKNYE